MSAAHLALIRFGFGPKPGEPLPGDPVRWLEAQLRADPRQPPGGAPLTDLTQGFALVEARRANPGAETNRRIAEIGIAERLAWCAGCLGTGTPLVERLVAFWTNHLAVSRRGGPMASLSAGHYVREAIRPHVLGRFEDMLVAAIRHPAMLAFLDNAGSVGPSSPAGQRRRRGLNENLAREVLELHTVSPAAGYTQADVTEFARVLTGWGIAPRWAGFAFRPEAHEPGDKRVMGQLVPEGEEGGIRFLRWLARHPNTHRHLAAKLVAHFFADQPDPAPIRVVEGALRDSGGHLGAAMRALVALPAALTAPPAKLRPPHDLTLATLRALGAPPERGLLAANGMARLAQPLWTPPSPQGWPDTAAAWSGPEAMLARVDWVYAMAGRFSRNDAQAAAEAVLGRLGRDVLRREIGRAGSTRDALTILLASPEFQRR